jgi:hypothetical protein
MTLPGVLVSTASEPVVVDRLQAAKKAKSVEVKIFLRIRIPMFSCTRIAYRMVLPSDLLFEVDEARSEIAGEMAGLNYTMPKAETSQLSLVFS